MGFYKNSLKKEESKVTAKIVPSGRTVIPNLSEKEQKKLDKAKKDIYLTTGDIDFLLREGELRVDKNIILKYAGIPSKYALLKEMV